MRKPVIGLTPLNDPEKESYWMLPGYLRGIEAAGGIPVILPPRAEPEDLETLLDRMDGILFTGGQDVDPTLYRQAPVEALGTLCPERDRLEARLLPLAMGRDLPILGICRGLQFINVMLGGTLWQDLPTGHPSDVPHRWNDPENEIAHFVQLTPESPLYDLLKVEKLGVNSHHHQAIRELAPCLREMARSGDGLVEAVWDPGQTFLWAVQWHPEMLPAEPSSGRIFGAFLEAARHAAAKKQRHSFR